LTSATSRSSNRGFSYDATGNRLTHKLNNVTTNYVTAIGSNRLMSLSGGSVRAYKYAPTRSKSPSSAVDDEAASCFPVGASLLATGRLAVAYKYTPTRNKSQSSAVGD